MKKRIIVAITGATGIIYGIRLLEVLRELDTETHLILSDAARQNILIETQYKIEYVENLAYKTHNIGNMAASISSGSFKTYGMVVIPCTIKTLSGIANSYNDNLIVRAADVVLKEKRRLVLVVRETPFHKGHLELMGKVADLGGIILPPVPAFYHKPKGIEDIIDHTVGKVLDLMDIDHNLFKRWEGK
ncbi:MAG TPA: UbiX family flavin prenyltransferase [Syntrophorhabdaceae bacterium]|nr:UbiX family flavin prenyltransferase [Syntrophorhabdaceae bacterium]HOL05117.1 UbiX family flavin prenyltransferase [Syntrophorhabdaceae bacterium]HON84565.1 UbiX family flavin prenyltransferase [Syntrophorhabdaceae bacterium]HOT41068.1 UbiX family flavin prenyltransferase [Syntrophorhabdaceae bacterium]HPC66229.1 UbiX family flavin prenyltransferase [Syntrophorhabdaceae bacterium]